MRHGNSFLPIELINITQDGEPLTFHDQTQRRFETLLLHIRETFAQRCKHSMSVLHQTLMALIDLDSVSRTATCNQFALTNRLRSHPRLGRLGRSGLVANIAPGWFFVAGL
jgi:hypothetical protein